MLRKLGPSFDTLAILVVRDIRNGPGLLLVAPDVRLDRVVLHDITIVRDKRDGPGLLLAAADVRLVALPCTTSPSSGTNATVLLVPVFLFFL